MLIKLSDILSVPDKKEILKAHLDIDSVVFQGNHYTILKADDFDVILTNVGKKKVSIEVNTNIILNLNCSRCLKDIPEGFNININDVVDLEQLESKEPDILDDICYVEDGCINVDKLIIDELFPMLPIQILCDENCKGICKICGCNLNEKQCSCDPHIMDPRMSVFGDVFNQFNPENKE